MQIAKCRLKLDQKGSDVPLMNVTPAEVLVLRRGHEGNAGGDAISGVEIIGEVTQSDAEEVSRLSRKYDNLRVKNSEGKDVSVVSLLFPGVGNKLPQTFAEIGITAPKATQIAPVNYTPDPAGGEDEGGANPFGEDVTDVPPVAKKK